MTVFISHAKEDAEGAVRIEQLIAYEDYQSWRFQRDMMQANPADPQLPTNIEDREIFLFTISEYSVKSEICQKELQHAALLQKRIVPVRLHRNVQVPSPLNDHQWVEFDNSQESAIQLIRTLRHAQPLRWEKIPDHWMMWDGTSRLELVTSIKQDEYTPPEQIDRDLTVCRKARHST